jgi:hypothetical protein
MAASWDSAVYTANPENYCGKSVQNPAGEQRSELLAPTKPFLSKAFRSAPKAVSNIRRLRLLGFVALGKSVLLQKGVECSAGDPQKPSSCGFVASANFQCAQELFLFQLGQGL